MEQVWFGRQGSFEYGKFCARWVPHLLTIDQNVFKSKQWTGWLSYTKESKEYPIARQGSGISFFMLFIYYLQKGKTIATEKYMQVFV